MHSISGVFTGALVAVAAMVALAAVPVAQAANPAGTTTPVTTRELPNVPGDNITAVLVTYPPAGSTPLHYHAGSVLAYVVSGAIRSQASGQGPARVYHAGESFFEPPGSEHMVSANASMTQPASLLAIFIAKSGATLTTMGARPASKAK